MRAPDIEPPARGANNPPDPPPPPPPFRPANGGGRELFLWRFLGEADRALPGLEEQQKLMRGWPR